MKEEYFKLKQEIQAILNEYVQSHCFEEAEVLYYDISEVSEEDGLELAFDIIYKESGENVAYIEETFLENVYERFYKSNNQVIADSLKKRIENNKSKPAANILYKQILDLKI